MARAIIVLRDGEIPVVAFICLVARLAIVSSNEPEIIVNSALIPSQLTISNWLSTRFLEGDSGQSAMKKRGTGWPLMRSNLDMSRLISISPDVILKRLDVSHMN